MKGDLIIKSLSFGFVFTQVETQKGTKNAGVCLFIDTEVSGIIKDYKLTNREIKI